MARRVYLATRDLFFRSKLGAVVRAAGAELVSTAHAADLAVIELGAPQGPVEARVRELRSGGRTVLAFGSHLAPDLLRRAREAGAEAVPNSRVEQRLAELLGTTP